MKDKPIEKPIGWCGSSYKDLTDEKTFTLEARKQAGHQLNQIQKDLILTIGNLLTLSVPAQRRFESTWMMGGFE
jgi:hypothetical protein